MTDKILVRKDGKVGTITFNNPERHNAASLDMWLAVASHLKDFARDDNIRVAVITGAGGKAFVSGADISKFEKERSTPEAIAAYNQAANGAMADIYNFPKPSIAMIRGYCLGGGMAVAVNCDLRVCTEASKFGVPAAKLGLGYRYDGLKRLVDVVGPSYTKEIFFTARQFTATEAQQMGLVNRVVADAELETYVAQMAETIAGNAPLTVDSIKFLVKQAVTIDDSQRDLKKGEEMVQACFASQDYVEGRRAFMEKRKPRFTGR